jgi:hypothetical protein
MGGRSVWGVRVRDFLNLGIHSPRLSAIFEANGARGKETGGRIPPGPPRRPAPGSPGPRSRSPRQPITKRPSPMAAHRSPPPHRSRTRHPAAFKPPPAERRPCALELPPLPCVPDHSLGRRHSFALLCPRCPRSPCFPGPVHWGALGLGSGHYTDGGIGPGIRRH